MFRYSNTWNHSQSQNLNISILHSHSRYSGLADSLLVRPYSGTQGFTEPSIYIQHQLPQGRSTAPNTTQ